MLLEVSLYIHVSCLNSVAVVLIKYSDYLPLSSARRHKAAQVVADPAVFSCISMLARAASSVLFNEMKQLLENMLAVGLSPALTRCLHVMAQEIPRIRKDIQGKSPSIPPIVFIMLLSTVSIDHNVSCYCEVHGLPLYISILLFCRGSPEDAVANSNEQGT